MSAGPFPNAVLQFFDNTGAVLSGGLLYTYVAGSTTPLATYTSSTGLTPNSNPVVLDSAGRASVFLSSASYRFDLKTSAGVLLWSADQIVSSPLNSITTASPNTFYAGPTTGAAAVPAFRAMVAADLPSLAGSYALADLSNLGTTAINAPLLPNTNIDLGAAATPFRNIFLCGAGTYGSTSIELTGTPTGNRVWTFPDASDTAVGLAATQTLAAKTLTRPKIGGALTYASRTPITADGTINQHTAAAYVITKGSIAALILPAPTVTTDDGIQILVMSSTAFAHVITATGLLKTGSANVNTATFAAFAGAGLILEAYQGLWFVQSQIGITFA